MYSYFFLIIQASIFWSFIQGGIYYEQFDKSVMYILTVNIDTDWINSRTKRPYNSRMK